MSPTMKLVGLLGLLPHVAAAAPPTVQVFGGPTAVVRAQIGAGASWRGAGWERIGGIDRPCFFTPSSTACNPLGLVSGATVATGGRVLAVGVHPATGAIVYGGFVMVGGIGRTANWDATGNLTVVPQLTAGIATIRAVAGGQNFGEDGSRPVFGSIGGSLDWLPLLPGTPTIGGVEAAVVQGATNVVVGFGGANSGHLTPLIWRGSGTNYTVSTLPGTAGIDTTLHSIDQLGQFAGGSFGGVAMVANLATGAITQLRDPFGASLFGVVTAITQTGAGPIAGVNGSDGLAYVCGPNLAANCALARNWVSTNYSGFNLGFDPMAVWGISIDATNINLLLEASAHLLRVDNLWGLPTPPPAEQPGPGKAEGWGSYGERDHAAFFSLRAEKDRSGRLSGWLTFTAHGLALFNTRYSKVDVFSSRVEVEGTGTVWTRDGFRSGTFKASATDAAKTPAANDRDRFAIEITVNSGPVHKSEGELRLGRIAVEKLP